MPAKPPTPINFLRDHFIDIPNPDDPEPEQIVLRPAAFFRRVSAISFQQSAFSHQRSVITLLSKKVDC